MRSIRDSDSTSRQWKRNQTDTRDNLHSAAAMRFMQQQNNRNRRRIVGGGSTSVSGMVFKGEYDPSQGYSSQNMVIFTPDGGSAGTYIALQTVVAGTSPDTGSPNWLALPNSPPGMWA